MNKKTIVRIVYLLIILIIASPVLAAGSKPIAGYVFLSDAVTPAQNATVIIYVNNTLVPSYNPCKTVPSVYSGIDGSFATNLANLKNSSGDGDCSGLWATGNAIWGEAEGSTIVVPGPQGNGSSSGNTVSSGSGLQYISNITLGANLLPNITLLAPPNNTITNPGSMTFNYSVDDDFGIVNCSLIINGTINQTNSSVVKNTLQTFTANLGVGAYDWSINCTDNSIEESSSETRTITISALVVGQLQTSLITPTTNINVNQNDFFPFTAQIICVGGDCGNVTAYLDPISPEEEKEKKPLALQIIDLLKDFFLEPGDFLTGLAAGNLVPTTPTTPFWTNSSNPADFNDFSCLNNMVAGSGCNVTWYVNATGNLSTVAEFFAYFNATTYSLYNETPHINITIIEFIPPTISNFTPSANSTYTGFQVIEISVNASDNTNISAVLANLTYPNGASEIITLVQVGNTSIFNTSYTIPNIEGVYNITFLVNDTFNNLNNTVSTYFNVIAIPGISELTQTANIINYFDVPLNHTVTVTNTGNESVNTSTPLPAGWIFVGGNNCTLNATNIICSLPVNSTAQYTVLDPGSSSAEYEVTAFPVNALNNNYTGNEVQFLNIQDKELFHTLVEYGRGRGNYFFDSAFAGAGSGHTGASCPYVPNGTLFELNFLHKLYNVNQYYGNLSATAYNAIFSCTYPNSSVVREHLISNIATDSSGAYADYFIPDITSSWERMGFLSMDFREDEQFIGENLIINCTNISYYFPVAGGYMYIAEDSFVLEVRDREPFAASASTADTIGNGTQEVLITYNINNTEIYTVDDVIIEIQAPPYAQFIGVRGELWGSALDQYRIEKGQLLPGESETIQLVVRFDTSNAPNITSVNLTSSIKIEYTTCWELNAYNPTEYIHELTPTGAAAVDMGTISSITNLVNLILQIDNILTTINSTIIDINETVNNIQTIVDIINTTTQDTNILVKAINSTTHDILNKTNILLNNTNIIYNDTQFLSDQLNCNGTVDTPLCDKVLSINQSIYDLYNLSLYLNYTAHNLNITVIENINISGVNITIEIDLTNLTSWLSKIKNEINCSNYTSNSVCDRVARIENYTIIINNTLNELQNTASYFNTTVFENFTFQDILDGMSGATVNTSEVLEALQKLREFDQEIVFLITDSFGLQQGATNEFAQGQLIPSLDSLTQANNKLKKAAAKLGIEKDILMSLDEGKPFNVIWILVSMIVIVSVAGLAFLFRRIPSERKKPPPQQALKPQSPLKPNPHFNQRFPVTENKNPMMRY